MTHPYRAGARLAGAMFLIAMAASLTGGILIVTAIDQADTLNELLDHRQALLTGVALETVNALAVLVIAAALWTPLRHSSTTAATAYLVIRAVEATVCAFAALMPLAMLALAEQGSTEGEALNAFRDSLVGTGVPVFFGAGALVLYAVLYQSGLVPKYIAIWGLIGAVGVLANMFVTDDAIRPALVLPIITNEVFLGIYLLVKGFRPAAER